MSQQTNDDLTRSGELDADPAPQHAPTTEPSRKVLTIERAKWRRGGDAGGSSKTLLFNQKDELMCCLGFDALACGVPLRYIQNAGDPADIFDLASFPEYVASRITDKATDEDDGNRWLTPAVRSAIEHNDDEKIDDDERERLIRADLMLLVWDDVVFV